MVSPFAASVVQLPVFPPPTVGGLHRAPAVLQARPFGSAVEEHACPKAFAGNMVNARPIETRLSRDKESVRFIATMRQKPCARLPRRWRTRRPADQP